MNEVTTHDMDDLENMLRKRPDAEYSVILFIRNVRTGESIHGEDSFVAGRNRGRGVRRDSLAGAGLLWGMKMPFG